MIKQFEILVRIMQMRIEMILAPNVPISTIIIIRRL